MGRNLPKVAYLAKPPWVLWVCVAPVPIPNPWTVLSPAVPTSASLFLGAGTEAVMGSSEVPVLTQLTAKGGDSHKVTVAAVTWGHASFVDVV